MPSLLGGSIKSGDATFGIAFAVCGGASTLLARTGTARAVLAFLLAGIAHSIIHNIKKTAAALATRR